MASRVLKAGTGRANARRSADRAAGLKVVISRLPVGPTGQSPGGPAARGGSSTTRGQGGLVWRSQSTNRAAADSASPTSPAPIAATACTKPDSTDARLLATTQVSTSTPGERHSDSAKYRASWVFPPGPRQFGAERAAGPPGAACSHTSATVAPGISVVSRPATVSGLTVKPSASGGTGPDQTGQDGACPSCPPVACDPSADISP